MRKLTAGALGFVIAPVVPALIVVARMAHDLKLGFYAPAVLAMYVPAAFFTLLFGLPMFLLFLRFRLIRWWTVLASGFAIGGIVALILQSPNFFPIEIFWTALAGMAGAFCFWICWQLGERDVTGAP